MAFQKYSNMEQSLFTRFVRLGVPTVDLDAQGMYCYVQTADVYSSLWARWDNSAENIYPAKTRLGPFSINPNDVMSNA